MSTSSHHHHQPLTASQQLQWRALAETELLQCEVYTYHEPAYYYCHDYITAVIPRFQALFHVCRQAPHNHCCSYSQQEYERVYQALQERVNKDPFRREMVKQEVYEALININEDYFPFIFEDRPVYPPLVPNKHPPFDWPINPKAVVEAEILEKWPDSINMGYLEDDANASQQAVTAWNTWRELDNIQKKTLADDFHHKSEQGVQAIATQYSDICQQGDPQAMASILLDLFLTVPSDKKHRLANPPSDFASDAYFQRVLKSLQNDTKRLEYLRNLPQDQRTLGGLQELQELVPRFAQGGEYDFETMQWQFMEKHFASDTVPSTEPMEDFLQELKKKCEDAWLEKNNQSSDNIWKGREEISKQYHEAISDNKEKLVKLSENYRKHTLVREHAMVALMPLLSYLSTKESRKLVYALFMDKNFADVHYDGFSSAIVKDFPLLGRTCCDIIDFNLTDWNRLSSDDYGGHDGPTRLFALAIPSNIVHAMIDFFLDRKLLNGCRDARNHRKLEVLPYLKRFAVENPDQVHAVHDALSSVIAQSFESFNMDWRQFLGETTGAHRMQRLRHMLMNERKVDADLLDRGQMGRVVEACIDTCALPVVRDLRLLFQTAPNYVNRLLVSYGDYGLVAVLSLMGVESEIRKRDYRSEGQMHRLTMVTDLGGSGGWRIQGPENPVLSFTRGQDGRLQMNLEPPSQEPVSYNFKEGAKAVAAQMKASERSADISEQCSHCGAAGVKLYSCSRCRCVKYCGRQCQITDWKKHKKHCAPAKS